MSGYASVQHKESYRSRGYAFLEQLLPPIVLEVFHGRMQRVLNLKNAPEYRSQTWLVTKPTIEVYSMQYPPMAALHWGLTPVAAELAECELLPSYAYFRAYQQGDICVVHSDREACEHSLSLMVELADGKSWALCIGEDQIDCPPAPERDFGDEPYASLPMKAGDAIMYRGVTHRHGRIDPNPNRWSAHLFFHWVDANGPYADHAFDKVALDKAAIAAAQGKS